MVLKLQNGRIRLREAFVESESVAITSMTTAGMDIASTTKSDGFRC